MNKTLSKPTLIFILAVVIYGMFWVGVHFDKFPWRLFK